MKQISLSVLLASLCSTIVGCATYGSSSTAELSEQQAVVCNYGFDRLSGSTRDYLLSNSFYSEVTRETSVGKPIRDGAILFYGKFNEVNKVASTPKTIYNKDLSPITPNWVWQPNEERPVIGMFTADNKSWWYLIETGVPLSYAYWTSAPNGMLCNNVVAIQRNTLTTRMGLSRVFQSAPVTFIDKPKAGKQPLSVSLSVIKVNGATADVEINAMANGRAIFTERANVDLIGGEFSVSGVTFTTKRKGDQTYLVSVKLPDNISVWIGSIRKS